MEVIGTSSDSAAVDDNHDDVNIPPLREKYDVFPPLQEKYDVFISFRGEDTRKTFTSHLHHAFRRKKIETYIDDRLKRGDEIETTLLEAIEKSRLSVIIFSKNYASSTWCLMELVHILKCKKKNGQMVVPIFYDISPSDVRKQKGSYADAFAELENRFEDRMDKVNEWKAALVEATGLCGSDYSNQKGTDADLIEEVVEDISTKLKREASYDLKGMVGIESRIEQVKSLLSTNDRQGVCTVGIWGMGGIGKTTLAKAVFKRLSSNFEASYLLNNVREKSEQKDGVDQLQKTLLREILKEENLSADSTSVRERLSRTKVLVVLDDVSDSRQIKDLAGDNLPYGDGSRIIVTSRERSVLMKAVSDEKYIYEVEKIKTDDALQLFQFHAFKDKSPREEYRELSARAVEYAGGIPLALEVLGSLLFPCESKDQWEDALSALTDNPNVEIQNTFKVSYNRLERHAQEVFLDIACFYKGEHIEDVKKMLDFGQLTGGSRAADGIRVLRDRSLISIDSVRETVDMHDLVQETGWAIVREECIDEPGRRRRLFIDEDICHVLKNNTGTKKVQAIFFNWSGIGKQNLGHADFKKMYNMRLLCFSSWFVEASNVKTLSLPNSLRYLLWFDYPLKSLPPEFSLENLVELHLPSSNVTQLWDGDQNPVNLKVIDLDGCSGLNALPQNFKNLDRLTYLSLSHCFSLEYLPEMPSNIEFLDLSSSGIKELPSSVWSHEKISSLNIAYCKKLKELPSNTCKLKVSGAFSLNGCTSLEKFRELPRGIDELDLSETAIEVLPTSSMECLFCLTKLTLNRCKNLVILPPSICKLKFLEELDLSETAIEELRISSMECRFCLTKLTLKRCKNLVILPQSICNLKFLEELDLTDCSELEVVPSSIYKLTNIKRLSFSFCFKLGNFPQSTGSVGFLSLEVLNLDYSGILKIPEGIICSTSLRYLDASNCSSLKTVSSSRTAITQCWNRYELLREQLSFFDCRWLGYDARISIMVDAQLRIMRAATASSKLKQEEELDSGPSVTIICPGDEIPNWFVHQNEGASINVRLPGNWFHEGFLGFALSFVGFDQAHSFRFCLACGPWRFECKYNFKTGEGESHEIKCYFTLDIGYRITKSDPNVFVLYKDLEYEERTKWSSAFYDRVTEVSAHFQLKVVGHYASLVVKKCGMCLLYAEDAEKLKCDVMSQQEQDEHAASGSGDPEASGSNESEEATGSDDHEGESKRRGSKRKQLD